jgi:D-glycero-D-manno-heptose 1,7-bisphosphate phosphatase
MNRAVFLDRDGVLNAIVVRGGTPYPPQSIEEFSLLPGVEQACRQLRQAGFLLVVVTNQPDVARGIQLRERVEAMNRQVLSELPVQDILTCYHDEADGCGCRKPKPGLILQAAGQWDIDLRGSYMVGDRWSDVEAGRASSCTSILVERSYSCRERCKPDRTAQDLAEAASIILDERSAT